MATPANSRQAGAAAQHQTLDGAQAQLTTLAAGASAVRTAVGTQWPLQPGLSLKIYNISCSALTDDDSVVVQALNVTAQLFDNAQTGIVRVPWIIAQKTFNPVVPADPNGGGAFATDFADPLLELTSGFNVSPLISNPSGPPAFLQLTAFAAVKNSDAVNAHNVGVQFIALMAFIVRG